MLRRFVVCAFVITLAVHAADQPGAAVFLSNCSFCHGVNGRGGRGPSLVSTNITQNTSADAIRNIIKNGIPGTGMPAFDMEPEDRDAVVLYLRQLAGLSSNRDVPSGDAQHGQAVYRSNGCASCHRIGNAGSVYGPELTRIGSARSADYLRESITKPSADIAQDYDGVTVETRDGKRVTGVRINEDSFSVQLRLPNQEFALFDKTGLRSVTDLDRSLMPSYAALSATDLNDIVAYLSSLRGEASGTDLTKAPEIH